MGFGTCNMREAHMLRHQCRVVFYTPVTIVYCMTVVVFNGSGQPRGHLLPTICRRGVGILEIGGENFGWG